MRPARERGSAPRREAPGADRAARHACDGHLDAPFDEVELDRLRRILVLDTAPDGNGSELAEAMRGLEDGEAIVATEIVTRK